MSFGAETVVIQMRRQALTLGLAVVNRLRAIASCKYASNELINLVSPVLLHFHLGQHEATRPLEPVANPLLVPINEIKPGHVGNALAVSSQPTRREERRLVGSN